MDIILKELYEEHESSEDSKVLIENLRRKRGIFKRKITIYLRKLKEFKDSNQLTPTLAKGQVEEITKNLKHVQNFDEAINKIMLKNKLQDADASYYDDELDGQSLYFLETEMELDIFREMSLTRTATSEGSHVVFDQLIGKLNLSEAKLPPIECPVFTGREKDKFSFNTFLNKFQDIIGSKVSLSSTTKQIYLFSYLKDYAHSVVCHLPIADGNYEIAIELLKKEFLDLEYIKDETLKNLLNAFPSNERDGDYTNIKSYCNEIKSYIYELKVNDLDFLEEGSSGNLLISHIVFNKLPSILKRELIRKTANNYPTINQIFEHYHDIIKALNISKSINKDSKHNNRKNYNSKGSQKIEKATKSSAGENTSEVVKPSNAKQVKSSTENLQTQSKRLYCKLCQNEGHTLGYCHQFNTCDSKLARLNDLGLCSRCAGPGHKAESCYGKQNKLKFACKICGTKEHITGLCPKNKSSSKIENNPKTAINLCLAQRLIDSNNILPTMTLYVRWGKRIQRVRCIVDTGSQRSYISADVVNKMWNVNDLRSFECNVETYNGQETRTFHQIALGIEILNKVWSIPILVDEHLNIQLEMPGMNYIVANFKEAGYDLLDAELLPANNNEVIAIDMLVGIDIIQHMPSFNIRKEMGGNCLVIGNRVAPIGNALSFLREGQRVKLNQCLKQSSDEREQVKTAVNLVMDPVKSYFNPLNHLLEDSTVDNGLEYLFSLESIGIKADEKELIDYDQEKVNKFRDGIIFKDGHYHVELPWHEDKLHLVPSNFNVALKVLDRTMSTLKRKGLIAEYEKVFDKQLEEGIIEEIDVPENNFGNYVWIPHRPVVKTEEQVTTKIRPVFNCSLKTCKEVPSLNEAAYTGIDLMGSILKLLLQFRTNNLTMLSDIKQAFLMIKLKKEEDMNKFCFFWRKGNKLVKYRYRTIVFGFTASPFILNYVMQHHMNEVLNDKNKEKLVNNFYVDNLFVTGNDVNEMKKTYKIANEKMQHGGFELRSWSSNSIELRDEMKADEKLTEHGYTEEKVLGYRYNVESDTLKIAPTKVETKLDTKRKVLSQITKVYDPLNFALPITVRGRIAMRKIWQAGFDWDQELPKEMCKEIEKLVKDTEMISEVTYPRQALNEDHSYGLHIFCDSSTESYGFVAYAVDRHDSSTYLFSKSKLAPVKGKEYSIPKLELLGVSLAFKCLPTILEAYSKMKFEFINVCVDAQVVLNWLMNQPTSIKSKFIKNRLMEIKTLGDTIRENSGIPVHYHYVKSEENPADMVTKGVSYLNYLKQLNFWLTGPEWLTNDFESWPKYPLLSLSPEHKTKINNTLTLQPAKVNTGIININKYSNYNDLLRNTSYLFKFLTKLKGGDARQMAKFYWIRKAQEECFKQEIEFLQSPTETNDKLIPPLVLNLNLFLDKEGILRSRGRISKCLYYNYDVHNPILLPKTHKLTQLIINYCHGKVQHLGIGTTLNFLREQGYWIPKGRSAVKGTISDCTLCRKFNALAFKYPKFTDMPKHQMNLVQPFEHTGVDYTGHIWVRNSENGVSTKMFILIFTCLNIRAVHFELLPDMTTKNFILAFQRFCNLYSIPRFLYSDNARTFLKGGSILEQSLNSNEFREELEKSGIKHIKIPLYSAWIGSAWERLIRVLKTCLFKTVGRAQLSYYELLTTLSNIKLAMNSRPLTYRSSTDQLEFITPNSFLNLYRNNSLVLKVDDQDIWTEEPGQHQMEASIDKMNEILQNFKSLWYQNYLLSLREHSRNLYQQNWDDRIKIGDIVLIKAPNKPRPFWMLGKVLEVIIGYDGKVRTVKLKQGNGSIEHHSIKNLYPLELSVTHQYNDRKVDDGGVAEARDTTQEVNSHESSRPKRKATERFRRIMREQIEDL